jgi:hypothetical protein
MSWLNTPKEDRAPMDVSDAVDWRQILIGFITLVLGILIYLTARPPDSAYFLEILNISLYKSLPNLFGKAGNNLPSFFHVFSFILISAGLIASNKKGYILICLGWFFIDLLFELAQRYNSFLLRLVPDWFEGLWFLESVKSYFVKGTFDYCDIFAITIGSLLAYFVLVGTVNRRELLR